MGTPSRSDASQDGPDGRLHSAWGWPEAYVPGKLRDGSEWERVGACVAERKEGVGVLGRISWGSPALSLPAPERSARPRGANAGQRTSLEGNLEPKRRVAII